MILYLAPNKLFKKCAGSATACYHKFLSVTAFTDVRQTVVTPIPTTFLSTQSAQTRSTREVLGQLHQYKKDTKTIAEHDIDKNLSDANFENGTVIFERTSKYLMIILHHYNFYAS